MSIQDRIAARRAAKAAGTLAPEAPAPTPAPAKPSGSSRAARFGTATVDDLPDDERDAATSTQKPSSESPAPSSASAAAPGETSLQAATPNATEATKDATEQAAPPSAPAPTGASDQSNMPVAGAPVQQLSRAQRFAAGLAQNEIDATEATETATEHQRPLSRADRFRASGEAMAARRQALDHQRQQGDSARNRTQPIEWDDDTRPPGSEYEESDWVQAEADNPGCVIVEMIKPKDRALIAFERDGANSLVLHRSMLIAKGVQSPWRANATAKMVFHHGEFGTFEYDVVRSHKERRVAPFMDGSLIVFKDAAVLEREAMKDRGAGGQSTRSRAERFK